MNYLINLLIALDQGLNALLGGYPDETVSFRAARAAAKGERWGCVLCKVLDWFVKDHCLHVVLNKHLSIMQRKL